VAWDCYNRSITKLGSTLNWDDTLTWIDKSYSGDPEKDMTYFNWNRVWVIYCDGSGHQGFIKDPVVINGTSLYFRG
jgi:hypothetical protein